jgi:hypothetical protein
MALLMELFRGGGSTNGFGLCRGPQNGTSWVSLCPGSGREAQGARREARGARREAQGARRGARGAGRGAHGKHDLPGVALAPRHELPGSPSQTLEFFPKKAVEAAGLGGVCILAWHGSLNRPILEPAL